METYLTIITSLLVLTQIIRVTQNAIQLHMTNRKIDETLGWIRKNDISEIDFEIQRAVFYRLYQKLEEEGYTACKGPRYDRRVRKRLEELRDDKD